MYDDEEDDIEQIDLTFEYEDGKSEVIRYDVHADVMDYILSLQEQLEAQIEATERVMLNLEVATGIAKTQEDLLRALRPSN
jgi:hypothetical protein